MLLDLRIAWTAWRLGLAERRYCRELSLASLYDVNRLAIHLARLEARRGSR